MNIQTKFAKHCPAGVAMIAIALGILAGVTGCTTAQVKETAVLSANAALLEAEYATARSTLEAIPFNISERSLVDSGVQGLEAIKNRLVNGEPVVEVFQLRVRLDEAAASAQIIKVAYESFLSRSEGILPDPVLVAYYDSATRVYEAMVDIYSRLDDGEIVPTKDLSDYMSLVLRLAIAFA